MARVVRNDSVGLMAYVMLFLAGLASSLHCVGMCGPFALVIAGERRERSWGRSALYNLARINTLAVIGAFCGAFGAVVVAAGPARELESALALIAGGLMLVVGLEMLGLLAGMSGRLAYFVQRGVGRVLGGVMRSRSPAAPVAMGVFNAFLPCHLIYAFAARAASTGSVGEGALTMTAFGLGTVPALLAVSTLRRWFPPGLAASLSVVSGVVVIGFALLTIARGFDAGTQCSAHH